VRDDSESMFESLDFLYMPSRDVAADLALYELTRPEADERLQGRRDFEPDGGG
jgi:hypothetical protein